VVVVGGGISGVELAAELAHVGRERVAVTLVSMGERLLPELSAGVGRKAAAVLRGLGVELRLRARVTVAEPEAVVLRAQAAEGEASAVEERIACAAAFWAGGIRPAPVLQHLGLPRTAEGWLAVGPTLQCFATAVPSQPDVLACGDAVRVVGGEGEWPTMQRAIECLWQAKVVAKNLVTLAAQRPEYPQGVPPLLPHVLRPRFAYGVSLGGQSLVVYDGARVNVPWVNVWFRRWLMRQYFARYAPRG
jgi:NADH:ubiquinone reductase (H+-translocating)